MKYFTLVFFFAISLPAFPKHFQSKVHSIDRAIKPNDPHLVMLDNGRVIFVKQKNERSLKAFEKSRTKDELLEVEVDKENNFVSAKVLRGSGSHDPEVNPQRDLTSYEPTVLENSAEATTIFSRMRRDYQNNSQCYNRAHVWAWEEHQKTGLKSVKHFMFFTRRYIRNYRYKWWFHVAPSVEVEGLGIRILDRRFTSGHRSVSEWTRDFVYSGRSCPVVHKYYDYRDNQENEDCYLIPVSMYFWQPRDIEKRDRTGFEKTSFIKSEVDYAYWEAF